VYIPDVNQKRRYFGAVFINGTTFSGNPILTTFGNTLRKMLMMGYVLVESGVATNDNVFDPLHYKGLYNWRNFGDD